MSTRGAVGFVANGKWYVTYNHGDSYPQELGMTVLEFCKTIEDWDAVKTNVEKVTLVDEHKSTPTPEQIEMYEGYSITHSIYGIRVANGVLEDWYNLLHELQNGRILYEIAVGNVEHMIDSHMFLADSLFCEWAYIIDLDDYTLKVYKGFNEEMCPDTPLPPDIDPKIDDNERWKDGNGSGYYPVKMLYAYNLDHLPEFMLGVTNKFKKEYRLLHRDNLVQALDKLK